MNLPILGNHDIVAPLPDAPELKFTFEEAQNLVTRAYSRFDPEYATAVREMFAKRRIDATPRFGKRNGAFCASWYRGKSAFVLDSFNGTLNDVYTLAHELGHATHDYYVSRSQTLMNTSVPSTVAETASIFGELLLTDLLLDEAKSDAQRKAVLCLVLDEAGMTTFQVTARVWFEQALYDSIQQGRIPGLQDHLQPLDPGAGPHLRRRSHLVPRNGSRMDHETALLHGELPLLQLPLRVRPNVRLLAL